MKAQELDVLKKAITLKKQDIINIMSDMLAIEKITQVYKLEDFESDFGILEIKFLNTINEYTVLLKNLP